MNVEVPPCAGLLLLYIIFEIIARGFTLSTGLLLLAAGALAQQDSARGVVVSERQYLAYTYSNDFFTATDRYFTQQIHPFLVLRAFKKLPLMKVLVQLPGAVIQYGLNATQDCFTPASIRRDTILRGDRPYSGAIYLGHFKISNQQAKKQRLTSQLDLGLIGPCAKCEEEQKGIHRWLNNIQPLGWENQLSTDFYLNYRVRYEKNVLSFGGFDLAGLAEINAGTAHNNAALGIHMRTGNMQGYFEDARSRRFQLYLSAQGWAKAVAYNASLQGGPFSTSINTLPYDEVAPLVLKAAIATGVSYRWFSVEHGLVFITREIRTWWPHGWGYINITGWF